MRKIIPLFFLSFALLACTTNMREQFQRVQVGMEKDEVLALMDSPQRTQRWHGMDRWTYIFYDENHRQEKEVHFSQGRANYVGDTYKPEISAEERDARNEASNKQLEDLYETRRQEARKTYLDFEQHMKGQDTIRYVPQFKPVQ